jgi:hypothetical protein
MMLLKAKRPSARLFTLRVGYSAAFSFGGLDGKLSWLLQSIGTIENY